MSGEWGLDIVQSCTLTEQADNRRLFMSDSSWPTVLYSLGNGWCLSRCRMWLLWRLSTVYCSSCLGIHRSLQGHFRHWSNKYTGIVADRRLYFFGSKYDLKEERAFKATVCRIWNSPHPLYIHKVLFTSSVKAKSLIQNPPKHLPSLSVNSTWLCLGAAACPCDTVLPFQFH